MTMNVPGTLDPACFTRDDEFSAAEGGDVLLTVSHELSDVCGRLEEIEETLRTSGPDSPRTKAVRDTIAEALQGLENSVLGPVDRARTTLIVGWGTPPHVAGRPDLPHTRTT